jgi:hypothetical protein
MPEQHSCQPRPEDVQVTEERGRWKLFLAGEFSVIPRIIPISFCPFCGEKLMPGSQ